LIRDQALVDDGLRLDVKSQNMIRSNFILLQLTKVLAFSNFISKNQIALISFGLIPPRNAATGFSAAFQQNAAREKKFSGFWP